MPRGDGVVWRGQIRGSSRNRDGSVRTYTVAIYRTEPATCTCADYMIRSKNAGRPGRTCKHIDEARRRIAERAPSTRPQAATPQPQVGSVPIVLAGTTVPFIPTIPVDRLPRSNRDTIRIDQGTGSAYGAITETDGVTATAEVVRVTKVPKAKPAPAPAPTPEAPPTDGLGLTAADIARRARRSTR